MSYSEVENNRKRYYWNEVLLSFKVNEYCGQNSESQIMLLMLFPYTNERTIDSNGEELVLYPQLECLQFWEAMTVQFHNKCTVPDYLHTAKMPERGTNIIGMKLRFIKRYLV